MVGVLKNTFKVKNSENRETSFNMASINEISARGSTAALKLRDIFIFQVQQSSRAPRVVNEIVGGWLKTEALIEEIVQNSSLSRTVTTFYEPTISLRNL